MTLPIRARLALFSGVLMALLLLGVGSFLYVRLEADLVDAVDEALQTRSAAIVDELTSGSVALDSHASGDEQLAALLDRDGGVLGSAGGFSVPELAGGPGPRFLDSDVRSDDGETLPARLLLAPADGERIVLVGTSLEDQHEALASLLALLLLGGPVAVVLASGVGWLIARRALRPVERMRLEAEAVSASEPGRRLPVPATRDELSRLGDSLNSMLARLEDAAKRERRFLDDAAHELRTPLANLKAELELALRKARTPEELTGSMESAKEETERLVRLAEDLLVLSRGGGGRLPIRREEVDVAGLLNETVAAFSARASESGVSLSGPSRDPIHARMDETRMQQAVGNLIENSLRHTSSGGAVTVEFEKNDNELSIEVRDTGKGFEPAFLSTAFEPFSREDPGRSRTDGGTGLGLTIVRAIVEAHGGSAEARNLSEGGAAVTLRFPDRELISGSRSSHEPEVILASPQGKEDA
ncbi:MAG: ATP-binding protein [Actinomycetota bacterium]